MDSANEPLSALEARRAPGVVLSSERERQALSRADIAQRLHMSVSQVEALEAGDYSRLPRGTFLRGFVRNYAKALGLDPEELTRTLAESAPRDPRPDIVVKSQNLRFDPNNERLSSPYLKAAAIAFVAIALGFAGMYWWLFIRPTPPAASARKPIVAEAPRAMPAPAAAAVAPPPIEKAPEPAKAEPAKPEPVKAEVAKAAAAKSEPARAAPVAAASEPPIDTIGVMAAGGSVIRFKFRGTAWVEIKDGRGKILLSKNNPGGSEAEVVGKPPFNVVVGNAPDVQVIYNNREFSLEPHTRVAVARFTLE